MTRSTMEEIMKWDKAKAMTLASRLNVGRKKEEPFYYASEDKNTGGFNVVKKRNGSKTVLMEIEVEKELFLKN